MVYDVEIQAIKLDMTKGMFSILLSYTTTFLYTITGKASSYRQATTTSTLSEEAKFSSYGSCESSLSYTLILYWLLYLKELVGKSDIEAKILELKGEQEHDVFLDWVT